MRLVFAAFLHHRRFAAGVSCSFAAPIGGLLLSIEEGASFYSTSLFWRGFLATCTGVCTLHFLAQFDEKPREIFDARFGIRRDLGLYDDNIALYGARFWYYIWELPIYVFLGCIAGVLGGLFIKLNIIFTAFRSKYIPASNRWRRFGEVSSSCCCRPKRSTYHANRHSTKECLRCTSSFPCCSRAPYQLQVLLAKRLCEN